MQANEIIEKAKLDFGKLANTTIGGVTGFSRIDGEWIVSLETLERKAIPDSMDLLGVYEVRLDVEGNIIRFERKRLRKRGETEN